MTPPAKTFMGSKINCFQGSIALCRRGAIARGFSKEIEILDIPICYYPVTYLLHKLQGVIHKFFEVYAI